MKTVSYVTEGYSYSDLFYASFSLFMFLWTYSDSLFSVELSLKIMIFDSSSSVEQTCDKVSSNRNSYDLILYVEKTCEIGICFVPVISVLTG